MHDNVRISLNEVKKNDLMTVNNDMKGKLVKLNLCVCKSVVSSCKKIMFLSSLQIGNKCLIHV